MSLFPYGEQGQKIRFLRYHLVCRKSGHLTKAPTRSLPDNAGIASEDTKLSPFSLPSAAHFLPRFSLRSQLCETLCGCACSFTPASQVCAHQYVMHIKHHLCPFVKNFFRKGRTFFYSRKLCTLNTPGSRPGQHRSVPRLYRRWVRNYRFPASARFLRSSDAGA